MSRFKNARWKIIVNPTAANGKAGRSWPVMEARLADHLSDFEVAYTSRPGHATELASRAIQAGFRHLIAVGGDGTNHEVVNGILQQEQTAGRDIIYTLLPVGTGNDWIRTHGIPKDFTEWLDMLEAGHCIQQEVGLVTYRSDGKTCRRYFVNVAGMAYDAYVVRYGEKWRSWIRNRFFYLLLVLRCLFRYRLVPGVIRVDGQTFEDRFYTINVGICRYSGGGMQLVPHADPADGRLALTFAGPVSKIGVLLNTWRFYNGTLGKHPKIETMQVKTVRVEAPGGEAGILLEADGEFLGCSPAEFSVIEKALTVIVARKK
jgi:YegS/Rv2252/BmrU family lipid kinase